MIHASLFSGIGGPEVAAVMLGWENAFHCEINPFGKAILDYWFPNSKSYEDVTKTSFKEWRGKIDVLTGGFPCQPFSYAGKRGGAGDDRYLWPEMLRAIGEIRPTWVVGENVAGITTMVEGWTLVDLGCDSSLFQEGDNIHRYELERAFTIERICRDFEGIGYSIQPLLIPAASVGAPHRRDRIFFLAYDAHSNNGDDRGEARKDEGKSQEEWLQEWDSIREPRVTSDARSTIQGTPSNTKDLLINRDKPRDGIHKGGGEVQQPRDNHRKDDVSRGRLSRYDWRDYEPERRWKKFPVVSPICRGNDGIPFPLDNLSISQTRWKSETLKAYGNAIVPQVMYRIFQAIEKVEKKRNIKETL